MSTPYKEGASSVNSVYTPKTTATQLGSSSQSITITSVISQPSQKGGKTRITCPLQVVNGLDFLKLSFWLDWSSTKLFEYLERLKEEVQAGEQQTIPFIVDRQFEWNLHRNGTSRYKYRLTTGDITLLINKRRSDGVVPTARLEIGSVSCWSPGFHDIYCRIVQWLNVLGATIVKETVSEVHLASDFIGVDINGLGIDREERWVSRVHKFNIHRERRKLSGITLGKGNLMLRIYDKVLELKSSSHKQEVFADVWGMFIYNQQPVTRVEFQIRREVLSEFENKVQTFSQLIIALESLWCYCTQSWAKFCNTEVNRNHNQSRAEVHEFWCDVAGVNWNGIHEITRKRRRQNKSLELIRTNMRGMAMTAAAFTDHSIYDLDSIIETAQLYIKQDLTFLFESDLKAFATKMKTKRNEIFVNI